MGGGRGDGPIDTKPGPKSVRASARGELRSLSRFPEPVEADPDRDDENFLFHLYRGSELLQDGREHEAKEELEQALMRKPGDQKGQDLLAVVYFRVGLFSRAIAIYEQLRAKSPRDPALRLNLALCYLKSGHPEAARGELEVLLEHHPDHPRAWGYLGLCFERLGLFSSAQAAFEKGGHPHLARRMMERAADLAATPDPDAPTPDSLRGRDLRPTANGVSRPLDAPDSTLDEDSAPSLTPTTPVPPLARAAAVDGDAPAPLASLDAPIESPRPELGTRPPSTRDGPPPIAAAPGPVANAIPPAPPTPEPPTRRKTLIVAPPPPGDPASLDSLRVPAIPQLSPPSQRVVLTEEPALSWSSGRLVSTPPGALAAPSIFPPPSASHFAKAASLAAPEEISVSLHASGVVIVRPTVTRPFATRLESIRAMTGALDSKILERKLRGQSLGETFGGLGSPLVELIGDGHLVVGPKPGHLLWSFVLDDLPCTVREDRVLGFQLSLVFDNELVELGATELRVVRYSGAGALVLETSSALVSLTVTAGVPVVVRREVVVGWLGALDVAPVLPADAPGAHHGLVRFQGDGSVLASGL